MKITLCFALLVACLGLHADEIGPTGATNAKPPKSIDVKTTCKAAGDGVRDDSFAIQRCINRAHTGQTIYFPDGTYKLGTTLNIKGGLSYMGQSTKAVL